MRISRKNSPAPPADNSVVALHLLFSLGSGLLLSAVLRSRSLTALTCPGCFQTYVVACFLVDLPLPDIPSHRVNFHTRGPVQMPNQRNAAQFMVEYRCASF